MVCRVWLGLLVVYFRSLWHFKINYIQLNTLLFFAKKKTYRVRERVYERAAAYVQSAHKLYTSPLPTNGANSNEHILKSNNNNNKERKKCTTPDYLIYCTLYCTHTQSAFDVQLNIIFCYFFLLFTLFVHSLLIFFFDRSSFRERKKEYELKNVSCNTESVFR